MPSEEQNQQPTSKSNRFAELGAAIDNDLQASSAELNEVKQIVGDTNTRVSKVETTVDATGTKLAEVDRTANDTNTRLSALEESLNAKVDSLGEVTRNAIQMLKWALGLTVALLLLIVGTLVKGGADEHNSGSNPEIGLRTAEPSAPSKTTEDTTDAEEVSDTSGQTGIGTELDGSSDGSSYDGDANEDTVLPERDLHDE